MSDLPLFETGQSPIKLSEIKSRQELAELLEVKDRGLRYAVYGVSSDKKYKIFEIPKKSGGTRRISAPNKQLKNLQRRLAHLLAKAYRPRAAVHGFTSEKSIVTNASVHLKRKYIFNVDLVDFFPSIHLGRIIGMLKSKPYLCSSEVATVIAQICCDGDGKLPQGAPTSPIISNMLCARLDGELSRLAKRLGWTYTRYADDLTFSTNKSKISEEIAIPAVDRGKDQWVAGRTLLQIIERNTFKINEQKVRMQFNKTQRQEVTGLVVNEISNVRRSYIKKLRAMLHNWKLKGLPASENKYLKSINGKIKDFKPSLTFPQIVKGKIEYIGHVRGKDDKIYLQFLKQISQLAPWLLSDNQFETLKSQNILEKLWYIEVEYSEDRFIGTGTAFFLKDYGLVTCAHVICLSPDKLNTVVTIQIMTRDMKTKVRVNPVPRAINHELDLAILEVKFDSPYLFESEEIPFSDEITGYPIKVAGFPNHSHTKSGVVISGEITGTSTLFSNEYFLVSAPIVTGNSGGPVFNSDGKVIGIAARGGNSDDSANETDFKGVIPVANLKLLEID